MLTQLILTAFFAHLIGDYYLQSEKTVQSSRTNFRSLLKHSLIYCIPFIVVYFLAVPSLQLMIYFGSLGLVHFLIAGIAYILNRFPAKNILSRWKNKEFILFFGNRILHLVAIIWISLCFYRRDLPLQPAPWIASQAAALNLSILMVMRWLDLLLLIFRPASLAIVNLSTRFQPSQLPWQTGRDSDPEKRETRAAAEDLSQSNNVYGAGEMIGFLERILMVIFLSLGQYASIGLIMTAKSIARYDKITKNGAFAEDYLIGTLASIIIAICGYLVVFGI